MAQALTPASDPWSRLSADPRVQPAVRASDADRQVVLDVLAGAFQEGRLDAAEHAERMGRALELKTVGESLPLLEDLVVAPRGPAAPLVPAPRRPDAAVERAPRMVSTAVQSWVALAVLFNVIWVSTWLFSGSAPYYYWPIWPMLGTGIPVVLALLARGRGGDR